MKTLVDCCVASLVSRFDGDTVVESMAELKPRMPAELFERLQEQAPPAHWTNKIPQRLIQSVRVHGELVWDAGWDVGWADATPHPASSRRKKTPPGKSKQSPQKRQDQRRRKCE